MRVGCPSRDLPVAILDAGTQSTSASTRGQWLTVFNTLIEDPDFDWALIDGTYVKAHQHSAGAVSDQAEAIGKSRAGNTSKIHLVVDAHGLPVASRSLEVTSMIVLPPPN